MIKTWQERCEEHPDHCGIITERMIQARMQEEIDDLLAETERLKAERDELLNALTELMAADTEYRQAQGGPWSHKRVPREVERRLMLAWQGAHAAIAKVEGKK